MESFSKNVKKQLESIEVKHKCCQYTQRAMKECENLLDCYDVCRCDGCKTVFVRGLFVKYGSVTDPAKQYHLDFSFRNEEERDKAYEIISSLGFEFRKTKRRERYIIYIKESSAIEDFLVYIGAQNAAFDVMNSKIVHEFKNSVNRQVNCDTANIEKQLASVKKYTDAIRLLEKSGKLDTLPDELKETARVRIENEQLSLSDIGNMLNPPVTKSGVRHRLDRILYFAQSEK